MSNGSLSSAPSTWVKRLAKTGLVAKGSVYCISGMLAIIAAFSQGDAGVDKADKKGVFNFIIEQPFGRWILYIIAAGLLCYAFWRFLLGIKDTENKGSDLKGIGSRIVYVFSGMIYASLAFYAARVAYTMQSERGDGGKDLAKELLNKPFGHWLLGIVGVAMIAVGLYQIGRAISGKYKKHVQQGNFKNEASTKILIKAGSVGYIARGIVWLIIGWLFIKSSLNSNAKEAGGTNTALEWLQSSPYGSYLLATIALGLIFYGIFMFLRAKYQPIHYKA